MRRLNRSKDFVSTLPKEINQKLVDGYRVKLFAKIKDSLDRKKLALEKEQIELKEFIYKRIEKNLFDSGRVTFYMGMQYILLGVEADIPKDSERVENHKEIMRRLGEVGNIMLHAGNLFIVTAIGIRNQDIEILKTTLNGAIETIWVGEDVTTDLTPDLHLDSFNNTNEAVNKIKDYLGIKGIIFNSWVYSI